VDRAGRLYWDQHWSDQPLPKDPKHRSEGIANYVNRRIEGYFGEAFANIETSGKHLLEIGCARSIWLPYFTNTFGFHVSGMDYSARGCEDTKRSLLSDGISSEILCADFFDPPSWVNNKYDVLVSFGVAEHFQDTQACIRAFANMLRPGGLMITFIPNMVGLVGYVQKLVDRAVFDIHMPLNVNDLRQGHEKADLEVLSCNYFLSTNFGVCNIEKRPQQTISWLCKKGLVAGLLRLSMAVWFVEGCGGFITPNAVTSPYIACLARKPASSK
jgi:2-polyprenyl-3-methyl-5-hydroxy-6-metoxy-1,4-benzoquinol methylase